LKKISHFFSPTLSEIFKIPARYYVGGFGNKVTAALYTYLSQKGVQFVNQGAVDIILADLTAKTKATIVLPNEKREFDKIILTSIWSEIGTGDKNRDKPLFFPGLPKPIHALVDNVDWSGITNPCIVSVPVYVKNTRANIPVTGDIVMCQSKKKWNYPFAIYNNLHQQDFVYQCLCTVDSTMTRNAAFEECKKNILMIFKKIYPAANKLEVEFAGATSDNVANYWCPLQPNVTPEQFRNGFYNKMESQQGLGNVYYCNIFTYFNYSGLAAQYATELVNGLFF